MGHLRILLLLFLPLSLWAQGTPDAMLALLPKSLGGCALEAIQKYDEPGLGSSVNYSKPGFLFTVYVYDYGKKNIGTALTDPVLQTAFENARAELPEAVRQGYYANLDERDHGTVKISPGHEVLRARYHLTRLKGGDANKPLISEIEVFGAQGQIVKLRISALLVDEAAHAKTIEKMIPAIMDALAGKKANP